VCKCLTPFRRHLSPKHLRRHPDGRTRKKTGDLNTTTTAHEDQFTTATQTIEPVRQLYDTAAILRRNVAKLEVALKQQTERAEAADEKLTTAREDMQSWIDSRNGWMERAGAAEAELAKMREQEPVAYVKYKATGGNVGLSWVAIPTGAFYPREGEQLYAAPVPAPAVPTDEQIHAAYRTALGQSIRERDMPEIRKFANELLQSADHSERNLEKVAPDCRNCANRVKRRCEACAILPCSCK